MTPDELAAALIAREEMPPEKGELGPVGPQGLPGQDGRAGSDGRPGAVGKAGLDGKTGPRGPKGDKGDKGDTGEPGKDGRDGKDGADAAVPIMRGGVVRGGGIAGITVQNAGTPVGTPNTITTLNFPSGGVTAGTGNSVDIPSGGGGSQTLAQTLALGNDANQLRITNAADGVDPSDVATVGQLGGGGLPELTDEGDVLAIGTGPGTALTIVQVEGGGPAQDAIYTIQVLATSGTFSLVYKAESDIQYVVTDIPFDIDAAALQQALASGAYPGSPSADYFAVTGAGTGGDPFVVEFIDSYGDQTGDMAEGDVLASVWTDPATLTDVLALSGGENIADALTGAAAPAAGNVFATIADVPVPGLANPLTADLNVGAYSIVASATGPGLDGNPVGIYGGGGNGQSIGASIVVQGGEANGIGGDVNIVGGTAFDGVSGGDIQVQAGESNLLTGLGGTANIVAGQAAQGGSSTLIGGVSHVNGNPGGGAALIGALDAMGGTGALVSVGGGDGSGNPGTVVITTAGVTFTWLQAAHVADGSSVDDLRDALIAAGLMAAS